MDAMEICRQNNDIQFGEIKEHLSKIDEVLMDVRLILQSQHVSLDDHIRRTEAAEKRLELLENNRYMMIGGYKTVLMLGGLITFGSALVGAIIKFL
jgi:hypothetical protein